MTNAKKARISELEKELAPMFANANSFDDRYSAVNEAVSAYFTDRISSGLSEEEYAVLEEYSDRIIELRGLYNELIYKPEEDEKALAYLFRDGMSTEEKLKALADAWWTAVNSGYSDAMANRLMAGEEDLQTRLWEQNCNNKRAIDRYYNWLKDQIEN